MTVYEIMTDRIVKQLEKGKVPWHKPWNGTEGMPKNLKSGATYRGINSFLLACSGFESSYWLTFKQCKEKKGAIKGGEKATPVIFWASFEKKDSDGNTQKIPFLRYYNVFNLDQCEGIEVPEKQKPKKLDFEPIAAAEKIVSRYLKGPTIGHNEAKAFYSPTKDVVNMPKKELFDSKEDYYSTLFHELTHSTGHSSRLDRKFSSGVNTFGSTDYSKEELVAEMGAAFLCCHSGIENNTIDNSIAYLQGWIRKFKDKPKMLISAAGQAQNAYFGSGASTKSK